MKDQRYEKLAAVLVHYCLEMRRGDLFEIDTPPLAEPLAIEVYEEALRAGAHPFIRVYLPSLSEVFFRTAKKHQLKYVNPVAEFTAEKIDKRLMIRATDNTKALTNTDPDRQAIARAAARGILSRVMERSATGELMWCLTQFPCHASAQEAQMSLDEYEDFVLKACMVHRKDPVAAWKKVHKEQARLCSFLNEQKMLRIVSAGTDISMSIEGRTWINSDGKKNMPSGEVFSAPVEDSVEGTISFSFPACYAGREVQGVRLRFKKGRVVEASASKGEDFLLATLNTDEGSRYLGEVAVGTNYSIERFTKNTLFDEKIGGTIHLALGAAYPDTGGRNRSSLHWDMVNDMRDGGRIYADGKLIYEDGKFVI